MLKIAYNEIYKHPLPEGHRFPMEKYELIPQQLLYEGTITSDNIFNPKAIEDHILKKTHCTKYISKLKNNQLSRAEERRIGFPHSEQLLKREYLITGGTVENVYHALEYGISFNVAGGTHHSFADYGEGFCIFNDFAVAANHFTKSNYLNKILIVDLDVHQGNGTASLMQDNKNVFTFSMHGKNNFPLKKEKSDLDIPLEDNINDDQYLDILFKTLPELTERVKPQFIMYLSGVDILANDKLGRLGLSINGCKARDQFVIEHCFQKKIPLTVSMGGGYADKISDIVEAHSNTYRIAANLYF
ncbi:MAG: histone deacetylase [Chitinophagaceae bacterium]|nr:MAG: histone deacetylase [Chitinophagaceae bacterium]